jgi:hypothetical protein
MASERRMEQGSGRIVPHSSHRERKRPTKNPRASEAHKALWRDPQHRAKMAAAGFCPVTAEDHHKAQLEAGDGPTKYSRLGVPTGYTRASMALLQAEAEQAADEAIRSLQAQGLLEAVVLPESDEALANAALRELFVIAIGPGNASTKLRALSALLSYTKAKPAERRAIMRADNPTEAWLKSLLLDETL